MVSAGIAVVLKPELVVVCLMKSPEKATNDEQKLFDFLVPLYIRWP